MGMNFDVAGINHQPFIARFGYELFQQGFPNAFVPPTAKPAVCVFPVAIVGWQIPPRRTCAQNPENRIDKQAVVFCLAAPSPFAPRQAGFQ
jgi:hypothetical protein